MKTEYEYPNKNATAEDIFSTKTLNRVLGDLFSWQQGVGAFGGLHLHACWQVSSVLGRRYQGQTVANQSYHRLQSMMTLYEWTSDPVWNRHARGIIENLIFCQDGEGGFRHASGENEPSYFSKQTCPIHQGLPLLGLLNYYVWPHCDPLLKDVIPGVIENHFAWFEKSFWRRGNGFKSPLPHAGWCGVTNQDLVIVAAFALYGKVFNKWQPFETFGKQTLDLYLSDLYYFPEIAKFERGDSANFVERTPYYEIILEMFRMIYDCTKDERLPAVIENIGNAIFDAAFEADDGLTYLAFGVQTFADDKTKINKWIQKPRYATPELLLSMEIHLKDYPDAGRQAIYKNVEKTFLQYAYSDGTVPHALGTDDPIFRTVGGNRWLSYLLHRLSDQKITSVQAEEPACLERHCDNLVYYTTPTAWRLMKDGKIIYTGIKIDSGAITIGAEEFERAKNLDFNSAAIIEHIK